MRGENDTGERRMMKLSRIAILSASAVLVLASARIVAAAINGFTCITPPGTNTIQSGDLFSVTFVQGTASNIWSETIRFVVGTGNSMTNNLSMTGSSYYNLSDGTITNGFYNGKTFNMNPLATSPVTNFGNYFEVGMSLNSSAYATSGTGAVATVTFQAYNHGPTNLPVPVQLFYTSVGRNTGTFSTDAKPNPTWTLKDSSVNLTNFTWVRILASPSPQVAGIAHDAGNSTVSLTVNLDPGTSNVVLYCTKLGGTKTPVTNIVISMNAPDKVTTNITGLPALGQKGFWRVKSFR